MRSPQNNSDHQESNLYGKTRSLYSSFSSESPTSPVKYLGVAGHELVKLCLFITVTAGWGTFQLGSYMIGWHLLGALLLASNDFSLVWTMVASLINLLEDIRYFLFKNWRVVARSGVAFAQGNCDCCQGDIVFGTNWCFSISWVHLEGSLFIKWSLKAKWSI